MGENAGVKYTDNNYRRQTNGQRKRERGTVGWKERERGEKMID